MIIKTKFCGEKEVKILEEVEGAPGLFVAEIEMEIPMIGFIDANNNEVVPFGTIISLEKVTALDEDTIVIDKSHVDKKFDQWSIHYGSILVARNENGFDVLFESNYSTFNIDDEKLIGAYVPDSKMSSVMIYKYNYRTKTGEKSAMNRWAYDSDRLDSFLDWKVSEKTPLSRRLMEKNSF